MRSKEDYIEMGIFPCDADMVQRCDRIFHQRNGRYLNALEVKAMGLIVAGQRVKEGS